MPVSHHRTDRKSPSDRGPYMHRTRLIAGAAVGAAVGLALAATMASTASAQPAAATRTAVVNSPTATAAQTSATLAYWTPARMRAAKPIGIVIGSKAPAAKPTAEQLAVTGAPGKVAGTPAGTTAPAKLLD